MLERVALLVAVLLLIMGGTAYFMQSRELKTAKSDLELCRSSVTNLEDALEDQNNAVAQLEKDRAAAVKSGADALKPIKERGRVLEARVKALQAEILTAKETSCVPAMQEIREKYLCADC